MNHWNRFAVIVATAMMWASAHARSIPGDRIFKSSFMETFVIEGKAGYPAPLANAAVEAHFGDLIATAHTMSDGSYRVGIEIDQLNPAAIVELVARGTGAESQIVWASPLGPESRLIDLAGADHKIGFAEEPLVHLNPRTTALAGAIRAFNGWQPVTNAATFYRAARARQPLVDDLMIGLALVARGDMSLPDEITDTFDAVTSLAASQALFAAERNMSVNCRTAPMYPYCVVKSTLPMDSEIFPPVTWAEGVIYSPTLPFGSISMAGLGFRPTTEGADVFPGTGASIPALVSQTADGGYELAPVAGGAFWSYEDVASVGGPPLRTIVSIVEYYLRFTHGPGGQLEMAVASSLHVTFPDDPEVPDADHPYDPAVIPQLVSDGNLPNELVGDIPGLANRIVVIPSVIPQPPSESTYGGYAYDVHAFGSSDGVAERSGTNFAFSTSGPTTVSIDSEGRHAEVEFVNEDEPEIWRIRMHVTGTDGENIVNGVVVPVDAPEFTEQSLPGNYRSRSRGQYCAGPYGDLEVLPLGPGLYAPYCGPSTFTFHDSGEVEHWEYWMNEPEQWSTWTLLGGIDAGRVLFHSTDDDTGSRYVYHRRGWELVHQAGTTYWILQNVTYDLDYIGGAPPIEFTPTPVLTRYELQ